MSCEKNGNRATAAAASAGLSRNSSKLSNVTGGLMSRLQQAGDSAVAVKIDRVIDTGGRMAAPAAAVVSGAFRVASAPETRKIAGVAGGAAAGYMLLKNRPAGARRAALGGVRTAAKIIPQVRTAARVIKKMELVSGLAGDVAGLASRKEQAGQVMQEKRSLLFFKRQVPVTMWKSSLTNVINRQDVLGTSRFSGKRIAASEGVVFRTGGQTWHRGTTVLNMPEGQRTLTHLQGLSLPASHYYFDRPVSDEQAVGVAAGKVRPDTVPGYVGQVGATESLCPGYAQAKHSLLRTRLHWPPESKPTTPEIEEREQT